MKKLLGFFLLFVTLPTLAFATSKDTIYVADFGLKPYNFTNGTPEVMAAIQACKEQKAKVLVFEEGRYDFWPVHNHTREYFISNTSTERECPSKVKNVGLLFEEMEGLTIEGNGASLVFHEKMITVTFAQSKNMTLKNISIDFERPTMSELTIHKVTPQGVEVKVHCDSRYAIDHNGKLHLFGEGWRTNHSHCIEFNPQTERSTYSHDNWQTLANAKVTEIAPQHLLFHTPSSFQPTEGNILTVRDIIRDHVGLFLYESENIKLDHVNLNYMHGLGVVSQYTRNITMQNVRCAPREDSGRILASSADFMQYSGCAGKILIQDCYFSGSHDDPINVHGTNLRAIEKLDDKTLTLRFMHGQSYGFKAFNPGDTVAFIRAQAMERFSSAKVTRVKRLTERTMEVSFDRAIPKDLKLNEDCVENMTWTPELEVRNNFFTRINARGTLVTTPRKVVIADNTYYKTGMSAILIEGDAQGWYESGPVKDVLIQNNHFIDCAYVAGPAHAVIATHPSNRIINVKRPVHRNIRIIGNTFETWGNPVLYAKSTEGVLFKDNKIVRKFELDKPAAPLFIFNGSSKVRILNNKIEGYADDKILMENMKKNNVSASF